MKIQQKNTYTYIWYICIHLFIELVIVLYFWSVQSPKKVLSLFKTEVFWVPNVCIHFEIDVEDLFTVDNEG